MKPSTVGFGFSSNISRKPNLPFNTPSSLHKNALLILAERFLCFFSNECSVAVHRVSRNNGNFVVVSLKTMIRPLIIFSVLCGLTFGCGTTHRETFSETHREFQQQAVHLTDSSTLHVIEADSSYSFIKNQENTHQKTAQTTDANEWIVEQVVERTDTTGSRVVETHRTTRRNYSQQTMHDYWTAMNHQNTQLHALSRQIDSLNKNTDHRTAQSETYRDSLTQRTDQQIFKPISWFARTRMQMVAFFCGMVVVVLLLMFRRKIGKHLK